MCLAWVLTVAAFIIIFIDVGGWVSEPVSEMPHALIGTITTGWGLKNLPTLAGDLIYLHI